MKKIAIAALVLVLSVLALSSVALAERGDIGGVGVNSVSPNKLR
jgi:hypothetical protein